MAWTGKSERFRNALKKPTPDRLGPGAYHGHSTLAVEHSMTPFCCGAVKTGPPAAKLEGAPPGAYDPKLPTAWDSGLPRKEVGFASSAQQRAGMATQSAAPDPGSYDVSQKFSPKHASRTMGRPQPDQQPLFKSYSAPSIPQAHQSGGYEEVGDGRLLPSPKRGVMTGRPGDAAGPGQYDVPSPSAMSLSGMKIGKRAVGGTFGGGPERIKDLPPSEVPGPGHYVAKPEGRGHILRAPTISSGFVSQATQRPGAKGGDLPGPGQYKVDKGVAGDKPPSLREMHPELQYFGSTTERFADPKKTCMPGPGEYKQPSRFVVPSVQPFGSTMGRFQKAGGKAQDTPGPGSYKPTLDSPTSGASGTVSILGAMGGMAFGSMERRAGMAPKQAGEMPGPGAYHDSSPSSRPRIPIPDAAFASKTPKDIDIQRTIKAGSQLAPPGAYDPGHCHDVSPVIRMPTSSEGFLSAAPRAAPYSTKMVVPAPGTYGVPGEVTGGKTFSTFNRTMIEGVPRKGRPSGLGFDGSETRLKGPEERPGKQMPGPGTYDRNVEWVSKTHNVHFGLA